MEHQTVLAELNGEVFLSAQLCCCSKCVVWAACRTVSQSHRGEALWLSNTRLSRYRTYDEGGHAFNPEIQQQFRVVDITNLWKSFTGLQTWVWKSRRGRIS